MFETIADRNWLWAAAGFYLAGFVLGTWSIVRGGKPSGAVNTVLILVGYGAQLIGLGLRGKAVQGCPLGNTFEIFQFTAWSAVTLYFMIGVTFRSSLLGYFSSCLSAALTLVSLVSPGWDATRRTGIFGGNALVELHAAVALFSYGVFALLALTSLMFLLRHFSLKSKQLGGMFSFLPSIMDLDLIGVRLLIAGVALLGVSLALGLIFWARGLAPVDTGKFIAPIIVWTAYSATLGLRLRGQLISKRFSWTCLVLFPLALASLAFVDASRYPINPPAKAASTR
jgi:ABC-type uncharacterized transport system permease subunit